MKSVKNIIATGSALAVAALLAGCGITDALSDTGQAANSIETDSESELGLAVSSVTCEDAAAGASYQFVCEGDSSLGPVRFQVEKNGNIVTYVPVNIFTQDEILGLDAGMKSDLELSDVDCGQEAPYYVPIDTLTMVCNGTTYDGAAVQVSVVVEEEPLSYTYSITG